MSEETPGGEAGREVAPTPFDGPWFLPVVLVGLGLWFAYDGWLNEDPDMQKHLWFNRGGTAVFAILALWYGFRAWRETRRPGGGDA